MVYNFTFSISSTGSWTGIKASLLDTSLCKLTFRAKKALRPAIRRDAKETREPSANRSSTLGSVFTAWSKWIWITRILWFNCYRFKRNGDTLCEWVPSESSGTSTGSNMVNCLTSSIDATCTRAWIYTFKIRTCSISWTIRVRNTFVRHCEYDSPKYPLIQLQASLLLLVCILHLLHKDWENMDLVVLL